MSVYPDGPEVAEEYPSVVDRVHRVRYLEQRVTSSERRARKLAVELAELRACLDAPFEKRNGPLFIGRFKHITPARKFRMLPHSNPTRQRGETTGSLAGASG